MTSEAAVTTSYELTARTSVRRLPERAVYDRAAVHAILDEGFICHVAFAVNGQPYAIPTGYARVGETLYLHGSSGSRLGPVTDPDEQQAALRALVDHIVPGRGDAVRGPDRKELAATAVLALPLVEVSAKVRTGAVSDEPEDYTLPVWAGVLPLRLTTGAPEPDEPLDPAVPLPAHVAAWRRPAPAKQAL